MTNKNVIHTFSINEAVEFLLDNTPFAAPMLLDAHTRPADRERIIQGVGGRNPELQGLISKTLDEINSESPEERYRSQEDFINFMNVDGLRFLNNVMRVRPRPYLRSKSGDYSEPLPIPDKAKDMKEFLYEYGNDYIEAIIMPEFNSGTQLMKLITMLREDAKDSKNEVARSLLDSIQNLMAERVRYEDPEHKEAVSNRLRGFLMEPEDADLRFEQVDDINFSLKMAMAKELETQVQQPPAPKSLGLGMKL